MGGGGGTEAFPDLGRHCQHPDCNQLDFLPFNCDGCRLVFCGEHRSYKSHQCPNSDHKNRRIIICEACSTSIEITGGREEDELALASHEASGDCDPARKKMMKKPVCPVRRCREVLTFSNTSTCKACGIKVCLKHRFSSDHTCAGGRPLSAGAAEGSRRWSEKFLAAFASRNGKECGAEERGSASRGQSPASTPAVKVS